MTTHSWYQQHKESDEYYQYFRIYLTLEPRTLTNVSVAIAATGDGEGTVAKEVSIETLTYIANKWKWLPRATDYDTYKSLLKSNAQSKERLSKIDNRFEWIDKQVNELMNNNTINTKEKLQQLEKLTKIESLLVDERLKSLKEVGKSLKKIENYDKNKYNFEADKQKDLEKIIIDYERGYISEEEYAVETKDYPEKLIENIKKNHTNPLDQLTNMMC